MRRLAAGPAPDYTGFVSSERNLKNYEELSTEDKIRCLQDLWDEIAADPERVELTDAQRAELEKRLRAHREGSGSSSPWSEVRERVRKKE